jgi:hypothetical protein
MDFLIARFHPTGTVDNQFGDAFGGKTVPFGSGYDAASALGLTPDGKIVVVGSATITLKTSASRGTAHYIYLGI